MVTVLQWDNVGGVWVIADSVVVDQLYHAVRYRAEWLAVPSFMAATILRTLNRAADGVECHEGGE